MYKLKLIKLILAIAAIFFIAKPFMGFKSVTNLRCAKHKLVLVKAFTKRKPEFLEDAEKEKISFHYKLTNPPQKSTSALALLLSSLFPFIFLLKQLQNGFGQLTTINSDSGSKTYLLTGKLTI